MAEETTPDRGDDVPDIVADPVKTAPETPAAEKTAPETPPADPTIPKARLDQEIGRRKRETEAAAAEIARLEAQLQQQRESADVRRLDARLQELDDARDAALTAGETDKAKALRAEMRRVERAITRAETMQVSIAAKEEAVAVVRYDFAVSQVEAEYPQLNPDLEGVFDESAAQEVADVMDAFKLKGMAPADAMRRAVRLVLGPPKAAVARAAETPDPAKDGLRRTPQQEADARIEAARRKAVDAATRGAPNTRAVGANSDAMGGEKKLTADAIARLDQKKFAALDEETLRTLRGDDI